MEYFPFGRSFLFMICTLITVIFMIIFGADFIMMLAQYKECNYETFKYLALEYVIFNIFGILMKITGDNAKKGLETFVEITSKKSYLSKEEEQFLINARQVIQKMKKI